MLLFPQRNKIVSNVVYHPRMTHEVHQRKIQILLLIEVLENTSRSYSFTQEENLLQLWTLKYDCLKTSSQVDSEQTIDENNVSQVEGQQSKSYVVLDWALVKDKDSLGFIRISGSLHRVSFDLEVLNVVPIIYVYRLISYLSRKGTIKVTYLKHFRLIWIYRQVYLH